MKSTGGALLNSAFKLKTVDDAPTAGGYYSMDLGDGLEICIEPLLFGRVYIAVYQDKDLVTEKIPFRVLLEGGDDE